jgi:hypothetical protein
MSHIQNAPTVRAPSSPFPHADACSLQMELPVDGYISRTFGSAGAERYFNRVLPGSNYNSLQLTNSEHWPDAFFITSPVPPGAPPSLLIAGRPAWLLDYHIRNFGTIVPQPIWRPQNPSDAQRYANVVLMLPIFFVHNNRRDLGLNLIHAAGGDCSEMLGARLPAPIGDRSTTYVRIKVGVSQVARPMNIEY